MPLPTTTATPLSLNEIQTEFGGSNPTELTEYYAGGSYVSAGTTGTYGAVPSSGAIGINNFYGTQAKYTIGKSVRIRAGSYFSDSFGTATSLTTMTFSMWVKRGSLGSTQMYTLWGTLNNYEFGQFHNDQLRLSPPSGTPYWISNQVFRDPSAWYHIVVVYDTTNATANLRMRAYVNGVEITSWSTQPTITQNAVCAQWNWSTGYIGQLGTGYSLDGYLADVYFVDGQALGPTSFGYFDTNGIWQPKSYSGTYGNNGFYLKFDDGTSGTTLGYDRSGRGNHWTPNNISTTAGVTYDWMNDSPTNNYCTLNFTDNAGASTFLNANLSVTCNTGNTNTGCKGTFAVNSGKWYWEWYGDNVINVGNTSTAPGLQASSEYVAYLPGYTPRSYVYWQDGTKRNNSTGVAYGATYTSGDIIGVALDMDAGTLTFYKNNVSQGVAFSGLTDYHVPLFWYNNGVNGNSTTHANFGQRPFAYTPPSGFVALCSQNLPAVTIKNPKLHFDVKTRTGTGASANITGIGFSPDLIWSKARNNPRGHSLFDRLRGVTAQLCSNITNAEATTSVELTAFNSDGFSVGTSSGGSSLGFINLLNDTMVDWLWKANGSGVTNTAGTITSTVSANTTAGFSIVAYTGNGSSTATVGHGLGIIPAFIISKNRDGFNNSQGYVDWSVYHKDVPNYNTTGAQAMYLMSTLNAGAAGGFMNRPTSAVFTPNQLNYDNYSGRTYINYVFAEIPGFSKFGSYVGNGSTDGPFVYCGFRPRYVMIKCYNQSGLSWTIWDSAREVSNQMQTVLFADLNLTDQTPYYIDILSNGFKLRGTHSAGNGSASYSYIFAAFAEQPFGGSNIYPANAR